ncbi:hypothetical protein P344_05800 [Spiroplasma mirum ATCC 29335]|uniref:Uncharacterized protein n=1 Tax=Spiroplasma mirum ATCC 29335 TaxID=838561 RepID=W6AMQ7_9MOLU|nr:MULTISPECIES: hypothetical protein [Spiroplasma]AHI58467.1 hypothetical protein P344_05800 [Spiroplasma mirum ATCC 29335]
MEEIKHFCERILYLNAGKLKADTSVKAVVSEYGSVFNYTKAMFDYYKNHEPADSKN